VAARPRLAQWQSLVDAVFTGLFLGAMDPTALAAVDERFYATHRERVGDGAALYTDSRHIRSGLMDWERAALTRHVAEGARLVITAAGAGREVLGALALGFDPVAFESHPELCAAGNRVLAAEGSPVRIAPCERDRFPPSGAADAVLVGWTSYSHIAGRGRRVRFLREARAFLAPGAPLIVSCWGVRARPRYFRVVARTAGLVRRLTRGEPPEPGDVLAPTFLHCFTPGELKEELRMGGFRCVEVILEPYAHAVAVAE
jgi:hypothetical protein